ncbi:MAG: type III-A CRISPR-associated RAMP protein Csm5 [Acidobacteriia bacterium]|nr:type III-A CRISPR-associated RAMP protein Csm5 [Terriglobia bacterium]
MKYRVTCLTPTLVGDGQKLAPIDYMVWKDHVNVLDQRRIFRLLSKGPRLEGYLTQLKTADKLDFASWGGFAQNFAGRRIPFEHASSVPVWERAHSENLFIPTFATSPSGPYLPATAIKGALRTGAVFDRWNENTLREIASRMEEDRAPRNPAAKAEDAVLGGHAGNRMRRVGTTDSAPVDYTGMKIYLLRTSTMVARGAGKFELGWKSPRGTADARRIDDSTPVFAEMAAPGMVFEGLWKENSPQDRQKLFQASNSFAASQIARHKAYAEAIGLERLSATLGDLEKRVPEAGNVAGNAACVLSLGWGAGMLSKISVADTADPSYRSILRHFSLYQKAVQTGLPFPKTRRIVFETGRPAYLPGWVLLEIC